MAAKTTFTKKEIIKILSHYPLGGLIDFESITRGTVQTNILVKTTRGNFVLRYYECRSMESVLFEVNLVRYLKKHNYPCPAPMKDNNGRFAGIFDGKPYVVFEFIEGVHIEDPDVEQKRQLIEKTALLQNLTKNYRPAYKEYRWNYGVELCEKLAEQEAAKIGTDDAGKKLEWLKNELSELELPKSLPKGICHCDFHFSNVLFKNGRFNALLDFDDANYTYLLFDLACLINPFIPTFNWSTWEKSGMTDNVFDFRETREVVTEYMKHRKLNNNEKCHLFDVFKLSILIDCVWYFKRGGSGDFYEKRKIDYLNRLGGDGFYMEVFE